MDHWSLVESIPPSVEPITLTEAKAHLRVDIDDGDALISSHIRVARRHVESVTNRQLCAATAQLVLDEFPSGENEEITLPRYPAHRITSLQYVDTSGATQTLAATEYELDKLSEPCRLRPAYGKSWPSARDKMAAVLVNFECGYLAKFTAVAATDLLTWVGRAPINGTTVVVSNSGGTLPAPFTADTNYTVLNASGQTSKLSLTGAAVDITDAGSGTHFIGAIPTELLAAMKLIIGHLQEHREAIMEDGRLSAVPMAVDALLSPYRLAWKSV